MIKSYVRKQKGMLFSEYTVLFYFSPLVYLCSHFTVSLWCVNVLIDRLIDVTCVCLCVTCVTCVTWCVDGRSCAAGPCQHGGTCVDVDATTASAVSVSSPATSSAAAVTAAAGAPAGTAASAAAYTCQCTQQWTGQHCETGNSTSQLETT